MDVILHVSGNKTIELGSEQPLLPTGRHFVFPLSYQLLLRYFSSEKLQPTTQMFHLFVSLNERAYSLEFSPSPILSLHVADPRRKTNP